MLSCFHLYFPSEPAAVTRAVTKVGKIWKLIRSILIKFLVITLTVTASMIFNYLIHDLLFYIMYVSHVILPSKYNGNFIGSSCEIVMDFKIIAL